MLLAAGLSGVTGIALIAVPETAASSMIDVAFAASIAAMLGMVIRRSGDSLQRTLCDECDAASRGSTILRERKLLGAERLSGHSAAGVQAES